MINGVIVADPLAFSPLEELIKWELPAVLRQFGTWLGASVSACRTLQVYVAVAILAHLRVSPTAVRCT